MEWIPRFLAITSTALALLATLLTGLGFLCLKSQKHFKSWRDDRYLDRLAGAFWGWAIIALAFAILSMIGGGA